jgi:hypothetical protein
MRIEMKRTGRADFNVTRAVALTLSPKTSTTFKATFTPRKSGCRKATVTVISNAAPVAVGLKGMGKSGVRLAPRYPK